MAKPRLDDSDYREYLEFFDEDRGRRPKLSRARFFECDEELVDLIVLEGIRKHSPVQRERQNLLLYLMGSSGTTYGRLSPGCRLELARMNRSGKKPRRRVSPERTLAKARVQMPEPGGTEGP